MSDLPEFKKVIHSHPVGEILQSRDIKSVANQINQMLSYEKSKWHPYLIAAKKDLCWENQETKLLSIFY